MARGETNIAAAFRNEDGNILTYTVRAYKSSCEEYCLDLWGEETYNRLLELGGKIVQIEIKELE